MTSGEIKQLLYREMKAWAGEQSTAMWRGSDVRAEWSQKNIAAVERLATHVLELSDDDPRFVRVAKAFDGQEWRLDGPRPFDPGLSGWLGMVGGPAADALNDPDEFITRWAATVPRRLNK